MPGSWHDVGGVLCLMLWADEISVVVRGVFFCFIYFYYHVFGNG